MNNSKEQTGKEGKSAEDILIANSFHVYEDGEDLCLKFTIQDAVKSLNEYAEPLNQRIAELEAINQRNCDSLKIQSDAINRLLVANNDLEAELKRKDEALEYLMKGVRGLPPLTAIAGLLTDHYIKAEQALKPKDR